MFNSRGVSKNIVLFAGLMIFGLAVFPVSASMAGETIGEYIDDSTITTKVNAEIVKDPEAHYLKINVSTTQGDVVLTGFVNSKDTEDRLMAKIKEIRGVKSVKSLLNLEERK
ncbi:MAG: BON domain-containing protein [Nitrospirales bacterium]|nr:BON domain-containing protein [Nitrospirales bacterium]